MRKREFVKSYFDAWNHRDPAGIADHMSADGVFRDVPENLLRSCEELIVSLDDYFANHRYRYELIGDVLENGDTVAFQYRMRPVTGTTAQTAPSTYKGAEFMTLNGGAAVSITDYYDMPVESAPGKYARSGLTRDKLPDLKLRVDRAMRSQKLFLDPNLTSPRLAATVGCSVNHLSQAINAGFGMSFFDYVNRHRIEYARELLIRHDGRDRSILNIAFAAGFNSNSAFYTAFRKFTGQTPARFRRTHADSQP